MLIMISSNFFNFFIFNEKLNQLNSKIFNKCNFVNLLFYLKIEFLREFYI